MWPYPPKTTSLKRRRRRRRKSKASHLNYYEDTGQHAKPIQRLLVDSRVCFFYCWMHDKKDHSVFSCCSINFSAQEINVRKTKKIHQKKNTRRKLYIWQRYKTDILSWVINHHHERRTLRPNILVWCGLKYFYQAWSKRSESSPEGAFLQL